MRRMEGETVVAAGLIERNLHHTRNFAQGEGASGTRHMGFL